MLKKIYFSALMALAVLTLSSAYSAWAQTSPNGDPNLTDQQKMDFLLNAKVIASKQSNVGITNPWTLTLSDGTITHKASFQAVDEHAISKSFANGTTELNFVDSYYFNIAAYRLAVMLGMNNMIPPYVERKWNGQRGALSWWVTWKWDGKMRAEQGLQAPDSDSWNKQMYKIRVFDELVYDTDPNLTNILITEDWKIWRVDFTRAFRNYNTLKLPQDLVMCDRQLLEKLKALDSDDVLAGTKPYLNKTQVKALMRRRDLIVETFQKLVTEKGEAAVLY